MVYRVIVVVLQFTEGEIIWIKFCMCFVKHWLAKAGQ